MKDALEAVRDASIGVFAGIIGVVLVEIILNPLLNSRYRAPNWNALFAASAVLDLVAVAAFLIPDVRQWVSRASLTAQSYAYGAVAAFVVGNTGFTLFLYGLSHPRG